MTFKDRLREEIDFQGKLVKELSAEVGISNSTFLSYIDARGVLPNVETAVKIANALNVSVEYLVTGKLNGSSKNSKKRNHESCTPPPYFSEEILEVISDLKKLSRKELGIVKKMVHALAERQ